MNESNRRTGFTSYVSRFPVKKKRIERDLFWCDTGKKESGKNDET